jgi:hypothetical protein
MVSPGPVAATLRHNRAREVTGRGARTAGGERAAVVDRR